MKEKKQHKQVWANAPLVYAVAEVAFSPHYMLAPLIPALQQALRGSFPRTVEGTEHELLFGNAAIAGSNQNASPRPFWTLINAAGTRAVHVSSRAVGLHSSEYKDSKEFLSSLESVLRSAEAAGFDVFVERAGLRYVDLIVPSEGHTSRDYLDASLIGPSTADDENLQHTVWGRTTERRGMFVRANVAAPAPTGIVLPPNLIALQLRNARPLDQAQEHKKNSRDTGWIDIDVSRPINEPYSAASINDIFRDLKSVIRDTFDSLVSDHAVQEWE